MASCCTKSARPPNSDPSLHTVPNTRPGGTPARETEPRGALPRLPRPLPPLLICSRKPPGVTAGLGGVFRWKPGGVAREGGYPYNRATSLSCISRGRYGPSPNEKPNDSSKGDDRVSGKQQKKIHSNVEAVGHGPFVRDCQAQHDGWNPCWGPTETRQAEPRPRATVATVRTMMAGKQRLRITFRAGSWTSISLSYHPISSCRSSIKNV